MGAAAAALLHAAAVDGAPVGTLHPPGTSLPDTLTLPVPPGLDLRRVCLAHAAVLLPPVGWDGERLHRRLRQGRRAVRVVVAQPAGAGTPLVLRHDLTGATPADLAGLAAEVADVVHLDPARDALLLRARTAYDDLRRTLPVLPVLAPGAGRSLRAPSAWEDALTCLAATNAHLRSTVRMVAGASGPAGVLTPEEVLRRGEPVLRAAGWGYRAPAVLALAAHAQAGATSSWRDPDVPHEQVAAQVRGLPGFGPHATAALLRLCGRPAAVVADGWLRRVVPVDLLAPLGELSGVVAQALASARWLDAAQAPGQGAATTSS